MRNEMPHEMRKGFCLTQLGQAANNSPADAMWLAKLDAWQRAFEAQSQATWAIYIENPMDFAAALFGAWHAGKTVVLPSDDLPATLDALQHLGYGFAGDLPNALQAHEAGTSSLIRQDLDPHTSQLLIFTSGSQGQPQAIPKTLAQLLAEVEALEETFAQQWGDRGANNAALTIWATVSHQHIYGLLFLVLWPLTCGRPIGPQRLLYPEDMLEKLSEQPCVLVTTPAHLKRLGRHLDWSNVHACLRAVFSSGGPLPSQVSIDAARLLGVAPIEIFGSSETGGIAWRCQQNEQSDWTALKGVTWRLKDDCLSISSPWLPDKNWWNTTDLATATASGSFRLLGRQDHIVKIEEKRISLTAIERDLMATPWVQEAKVIVVPTAIGDRVGAVIVASQAGQSLLREQARGQHDLSKRLRDMLRTSCDPLALPKRWRFVDEMPVDAQGKPSARLLRPLFAERPGQAASMPEAPPFTWLKREPQEALICLDIHPRLSALNGHFPQAAILPGVAQLDWALTLGHQCFDLPPTLLRLEAIKFVKPVMPGVSVYLSLTLKEKAMQPGVKVLHFRWYSQPDASADVTEHANGRALWTEEESNSHA